MGKASRIALAVVLLAACGKSKERTGGATNVDAAAPPSTGSAASRPPPPSTEEVVSDELYRAPGGGAQLVAPTLGAGWTRSFVREGEIAIVRYQLADGARRVQLELRFPPRQPKALDPKTVAEAGLKALTSSMPGATVMFSTAAALPGGPGWRTRALAEIKGARVGIEVVAIAEGGDAVMIASLADDAVLDAADVKAALQAIVDGVQVGARVRAPTGPVATAPTPAPATPSISGSSLSGVFIRLGRDPGEVYLYEFDPGGWAVADAQVGTVTVAAARTSGTASRYEVRGEEVHITGPGGRDETLTKQGGDLALAHRTFCRAAATDGLRLSGRYTSHAFVGYAAPSGEYTASASETFEFAQDGTYLDAATMSASQPGVATGARDAGAGRYQLRGSRLELTRGGKTISLPFYMRACEGKLSYTRLVIGGALYMED